MIVLQECVLRLPQLIPLEVRRGAVVLRNFLSL